MMVFVLSSITYIALFWMMISHQDWTRKFGQKKLKLEVLGKAQSSLSDGLPIHLSLATANSKKPRLLTRTYLSKTAFSPSNLLFKTYTSSKPITSLTSPSKASALPMCLATALLPPTSPTAASSIRLNQAASTPKRELSSDMAGLRLLRSSPQGTGSGLRSGCYRCRTPTDLG